MKKKFSSIFNDTNVSALENIKSQISSIIESDRIDVFQKEEQIKNPETPFVFQETFYQCSKCLVESIQKSQMIWPCKCNQPIHLKCLEMQLSARIIKDERKNQIFKCQNCGKKYQVQILHQYKLECQKKYICQKSIIIYLFGLTLLLVGIVGLSFYYGQLLNENPISKDNQNKLNISNQVVKNEQQNQKSNLFSKIELKTFILQILCILIVIFIFLIALFIKKYLLIKKLVINKTIKKIPRCVKFKIQKPQFQQSDLSQIKSIQPLKT